MNILRRWILTGAATAVAAGALASGASADSGSVVTVARQQEKVLTQVFSTVHFDKLTSAAQARKYVPKLQAVKTRLQHGAALVAAATATTELPREGQQEWVKAIRGIATGIGQLETAYGDIADGKDKAALPLLAKAKQAVTRAAKLGDRADELLGLNGSGGA
jgi:hypothetical protein